MSEEGNTEELQRWDLWRDPEFPDDRSIEKCHNGDFVLFSDVAEREGRLREAAWNAVAWWELFDLGEAGPSDVREAAEELRKALEEGAVPALCPGCGEGMDAWRGMDFYCAHPFHRLEARDA